jgi:hypothetical protein
MINPDQPDFNLTPAHPARKNLAPRLAAWNDLPVVSIVTPFYNTGQSFMKLPTASSNSHCNIGSG